MRVVYSPLDALTLAQREPGPAGGVLRHRLRDHRPGQRDDRVPGETARHQELLAAGLARAGTAGDRRDHGVADLPGAGVPGRRARLQRDGHRASIRRWREVQRAHRRHRVRAAGHPRGHPAHGAAAGIGPPRAGERLPARRASRGQPGGEGDAAGRVRGDRPGVARHRHDPGSGWRLVVRRTASSTPSTGSPSPTSTPRNRRCAAPGRCCRG